MNDDPLADVDYDENGAGPTILFVPGSCSTGAAWRPVISRLTGCARTITTSLPGYGGTAERRTGSDRLMTPIIACLEAVIRRAEAPVHLVGHSFGGLAGLAFALEGRVPLESLTILEAPAPGVLKIAGMQEPYEVFRRMTDAYIDKYENGDTEAIASMIDFYGGVGTFASWPPAVRAYAVKTTATNILDWESAYAFAPEIDALAQLNLPVLVCVGRDSHPAVALANKLISESIPNSTYCTIQDASHFMIATHPSETAKLIIDHIDRVESPTSRVGT